MTARGIDDYPARVGAVIARLRKARGLTQTDLAPSIGRVVSIVCRIERGQSALTVAQLARIAAALGVSPSDILRQADDPG